MPKRLYYKFERWNDRWGAAVVLFLLATVAVSVAGTGFLYLTRGQAVRSFLDCSDQRDAYAAQQSQRLRDATDAHDLAVQKADVADLEWSVLLDRAFQKGTKSTKAEIAEFARATHAREVARADAVAASRDLRRVRKATPVVPAASELCRDGVFQRPSNIPTQPAPTPSVGGSSPKALSPNGPTVSVSPSVVGPPDSAAPTQPAPMPSPTPHPTPTRTVTVTPTPTPSQSPSGLAAVVDRALKQLGLPTLPPVLP